MKSFKSINPFNQSVINEYAVMGDRDIEHAVKNAGAAFAEWKNTLLQQRSNHLKNVAGILRKNKDVYAKTISLEMGKILNESFAEIEKCALCCEYYAEHAKELLADEIISSDAKKSFVSYEPLGAVFAVMPWNFPFWQVFRFAVPSLIAGNVALLKHAPNVCGCSKEIENIFREAGLPQNVLQSLIIETGKTEKIISYDIVQGVTVTGSELAGSSVAALAGKYIRKSVLELGGSDPFIILDDADIHKAAQIAVQSRMQNAGQSCIAAKRFIVIEKIKPDFLHAFTAEVKKLKQGNPFDDSVTTGPLARIDLAEKLELQQNTSIQQGAHLLFGGKRNDCNYEPAILENVQKGMPAFDEEMFGPVAAIISAKNEEDAIELANGNKYGLGSTIFSRDIAHATELAKKIRSGSVFINAKVKSDVHLPFGGIKKSGYGRELSGYGIKEFTNIKTVYAGG